MYKCDQASLSREFLNPKSNCLETLRETFTLQKIISQDVNDVVFKVLDKETNNFLALKITHNIEHGVQELEILHQIREEILDRGRSPCFIRCEYWTICGKMPEIDTFEPTFLNNFGSEDAYLYSLMNTSDFSLENMPYQPTQYEIKCIIFELLYAYHLSQELGIGLNIRTDNILITEDETDRLYNMGKEQFRISGRYLPMYSDFLSEESSEGDLNLLIEIFSYVINEYVDLSELFVNQFTNLVELLKNEDILKALEESTFFDDLDVKSEVSVRLARENVIEILP